MEIQALGLRQTSLQGKKTNKSLEGSKDKSLNALREKTKDLSYL